MNNEAPASIPSMNIKRLMEDPKEREWQGPFTYVVGSDTQFGMIERIINKSFVPNWEKEISLTRDLIVQVNAMNPKPKFLVICGDMLDAYPFAKLGAIHNPNCGDAKRRKEQYKDFVQLFKELDPEIKLVCVCGNHDIGDIPTHESLQVYRSEFGRDYFHFWAGGVKFVVLNSQYMYSPEAIPEETEKQLQYIDTIHDAHAKFIVAFQHIPYFTSHLEEEAYGNLSLPELQRVILLDKLHEQGVQYIFCGHWHRNGVQHYKGMEQIITSAIGCAYGKEPSGYRIVNVEEEKISHYYVSLEGGVAVDEEY